MTGGHTDQRGRPAVLGLARGREVAHVAPGLADGEERRKKNGQTGRLAVRMPSSSESGAM
eukprot:scaffold57908_cov22-Tisochrysis_lutea.AAC.5